MASFDPEESREQSRSPGAPGIVQHPMKRLEVSVRNFIKSLDIDLDRLHRHSENIKKLTNAEDWAGLHKEQVNASRTVQQINANIREIERVRTQVVDQDLGLFDSKVQDVKMKAVSAMEEFMILIGPGTTAASSKHRPVVETGHGCDTLELPSSPPAFSDEVHKVKSTGRHSIQYEEDSVDSLIESNASSPYGNTSVSMMTFAPAPVTTSLHVAPQHTDASNSWEQLQENIVELNELVHHFADQVEQQGEVLNTIDENIETAHANVKEGTASLAQASKYKSVFLPVVGAVVGGMVGGPIGVVAGMKLGGLAGIAGGISGFVGGKMLKKHQSKIAQTELENLSDKRSISLTEINGSFTTSTERRELQRDSDSVMETRLLNNEREITQDGEPGQTQAGSVGLTDLYNGVTSSFRSLFSQSSSAEGKC